MKKTPSKNSQVGSTLPLGPDKATLDRGSNCSPVNGRTSSSFGLKTLSQSPAGLSNLSEGANTETGIETGALSDDVTTGADMETGDTNEDTFMGETDTQLAAETVAQLQRKGSSFL